MGDIKRRGNHYYTEGHILQKKASFLQSEAGITNWGNWYYKVGQLIYYKVRQISLESEVDINKWGSFITKCGRYYKVGNYYRKG